MKKIIAVLLAGLLLSAFVGCDSDSTSGTSAESESTPQSETQSETEEQTEEAKELKYTTTKLNSSTPGIKTLGERNLASKTQINCDWSCSGIEFNITSNGGDIKFDITSGAACYFRVYLDDIPWENGNKTYYYTINGYGTVKLEDIPKGEHNVKLMKVTGHTIARAAVTAVTYSGEIHKSAPADNARYIEFVGDSITCAWGTIGSHQGAYTDQDGTLAYSYLLADALGADYSMTALSGQGLLCGNPGMTRGYLLTSPLRNAAQEYSFERKADLVIVNIGTNDVFKREAEGITEESFRAAYKAFLETIKEKNGTDCKILCLYNCMNSTFSEQIVSVCEELGGESAGIKHMKLSRADGNNHPSESEHVAYFNTLKHEVEAMLK